MKTHETPMNTQETSGDRKAAYERQKAEIEAKCQKRRGELELAKKELALFTPYSYKELSDAIRAGTSQTIRYGLDSNRDLFGMVRAIMEEERKNEAERIRALQVALSQLTLGA